MKISVGWTEISVAQVIGPGKGVLSRVMATSMGEREDAPRPQGTASDEQAQLGDTRFTEGERQRFPTLMVGGLLMAVAVILVAWVVLGYEYAIPLLLLTVIGVLVLVGFRLISSRNRDPAASEEGGLPAQAPDPTRPLGDTAEAHDEINPHDFPLYNPGRRAAERMARGPSNTTRGMKDGAAAGRGGSAEGDMQAVGDDEAGGASLESSFGPKRD